mmetsp:Transcript_4560/g.11711  ORF Transcript_4560/g.11711 Transcript_4560/m.11711 type:complete len:260 (-) Transcript_4560:204-983(-)
MRQRRRGQRRGLQAHGRHEAAGGRGKRALFRRGQKVEAGPGAQRQLTHHQPAAHLKRTVRPPRDGERHRPPLALCLRVLRHVRLRRHLCPELAGELHHLVAVGLPIEHGDHPLLHRAHAEDALKGTARPVVRISAVLEARQRDHVGLVPLVEEVRHRLVRRLHRGVDKCERGLNFLHLEAQLRRCQHRYCHRLEVLAALHHVEDVPLPAPSRRLRGQLRHHHARPLGPHRVLRIVALDELRRVGRQLVLVRILLVAALQ